MASGNTLLIFPAIAGEPPPTAFAQVDTRGADSHPILDFDDTTQEAIYFTGILPRHYAGGGITVYLHWMATTAVSGTGGWDVAFERMSDGATDLDAASYATAQTVTAATVPAAAGIIAVTNVAVSNGANMDNIAAGEAFRLRVRRDVANDTAVGDLELVAVELKET